MPIYIRVFSIHSVTKKIFIKFIIHLEFVPDTTNVSNCIGTTLESYYVCRYHEQPSKTDYDKPIKIDSEIFKRLMLHLILNNFVSEHYIRTEHI